MDGKIREVSQTFERFKAALLGSDFDISTRLLSQLKVLLTEFRSLPPLLEATPNAAHELTLARDIYEHAVVLSVKMEDQDAFERDFCQLKPYYTDARDRIPQSPQEYPILGLNLLRLLVQNRIAEFHTELELLSSAALESPCIKHAVELEQSFMEGAYNRVLTARQSVPHETYVHFMDLLAKTVRDEIAGCSEKAYDSLSLSDAKQMLMFSSDKDLQEYINEEKKEKDKIFLHATVHDSEKFNYGKFLTIDLKKGQVSECPYALLAERGLNSMVSIGSVIYVVGGMKPDGMRSNKRPPNSSSANKKGIYHKGMSFLDLSSDSGQGWVEVPYFSDTPDCSPSVLAFAGKIYLFVNGDSKAGIFDPMSNTWETLLPPPDHSIFDIICPRSAVPDPDNNRILLDFGTMGCYYAYYPDEKRWEKLVDFIPFFPKHVFADGVFYVYNPEMPDIVEAYDVSSKQWLTIEFTSEVHYRVWRYEFDDMFYLGNGLICFAGYSPNYDLPGTRTNVFIAKIRFHRSTARPNHLVATPFPLEIYTLDPPYAAIQSYLPI